jgi:hypothetical protein
MPRLTFYQLFRLIDPNTIEVLRRLKVGPVNFNAGDTIPKGRIVAGIDFFNYLGSEIDVEVEQGVWVVKRIYARPSR